LSRKILLLQRTLFVYTFKALLAFPHHIKSFLLLQFNIRRVSRSCRLAVVAVSSGERSEKSAKKTTTSSDAATSSGKATIPDFLAVKDPLYLASQEPLDRKGLRPSLPDNVATSNNQVRLLGTSTV
jgi:hypothetical protein